MSDDDTYRKFVKSVIDNVKKHGFPDKKVAFPLETMYGIAEKKGINFNRVLETLDSIQIAHEKTPEKIIFYPKDRVAEKNEKDVEDGFQSSSPDIFQNLDFGRLGKVSPEDMMAAAASMMQNMSPEQLSNIKAMYENMSDEERAALIEQVKNLGLFK
jgi:hypothetical protein